jgi:bis(5'-nucleosidyl)-tetraphosphatase
MINSAGVIIINENNHVLLLRAYANWDFPKGRQEEGETLLDTALREVKEESSLTQLEFAWGLDYYQTDAYSKPRKQAFYFVAKTKHKPQDVVLNISPILGKPEHDEYRWCSFADAYLLLNERCSLALAWAEKKIK